MNKNSLNKPKIAVIGLKGLPAFGGAAAAMEGVINRLKNDFEFTVYSVDSHTQISGLWNGIEQILFKKTFHPAFNLFIYFLKSALHCLFTRRFDVIHVHHLAGAFIIPFLRLKYTNVIFTSHGMPDKRDKWKNIAKFYYPIMRFCAVHFATKLTTVSKLDEKYYLSLKKREIIYIPNGILINKNPKTQDENTYEEFLMFAAGRIMATKGLHIFLEALKKNNYNKRIVVAGDLDHMVSYKKKIMQISMGLNVEFLGLIKNKTELLNLISNAKLFIFPSSIEAMSMMLLEVGTTKTPIIASDIPENKVIYSENEVLYFSTGNYYDLAQKISYALNHYDEMVAKAEKAYEKLLNNFNVEWVAKKYTNLYDSIID